MELSLICPPKAGQYRANPRAKDCITMMQWARKGRGPHGLADGFLEHKGKSNLPDRYRDDFYPSEHPTRADKLPNQSKGPILAPLICQCMTSFRVNNAGQLHLFPPGFLFLEWVHNLRGFHTLYLIQGDWSIQSRQKPLFNNRG